MRRFRALPAVALIAVLATLAAACVPPPPGPPETTPIFAEAGPYAVGVTTVELSDRQMEVWYPVAPEAVQGSTHDSYYIRDFLSPFVQSLLPADINPPLETDAFREAPVFRRKSRFPVVLFSHGASSYRLQSTFLTTHLASWGFVVASPDFLERGLQSFLGTPPNPAKTSVQVLRETVDRLKALDADPASQLRGRLATDRVFPIGHSAGGSASTQFAGETDVASWISMSAGLFGSTALPTDPKPSMWIVGENDGVVPPAGVEEAYEQAQAPKRLVIVGGSGHNNGFSDICTIGANGGGLIGLAEEAGLPIPESLKRLAQDGCLDPNLPSETVWPAVRHFVTAELRLQAGRNELEWGLGAGVEDRFGEVGITYEQVAA